MRHKGLKLQKYIFKDFANKLFKNWKWNIQSKLRGIFSVPKILKYFCMRLITFMEHKDSKELQDIRG